MRARVSLLLCNTIKAQGVKFQIPIPRNAGPNSKNQNQMTETFGTVRVWSLEFEYWNLFGAWDLALLDYWDLEFSA
jgi:hypothetical protein